MERASTRLHAVGPLEPARVAAAAKRAAAAARQSSDPATAIDTAVGALHEALPGILPSVFMLEHGRLWLVAQRGYAVVPDGIRVEKGVMGRALHQGRAQLVADVRSDADYVAALPSVVSELAVPLRSDHAVVGALNLESERPLPPDAARLMRPLAGVLGPVVDALRASRTLDLAALARLFVHLGSLRDPDEIAALAAASLARVLPTVAAQLVLWGESGAPVEVASWQADDPARGPLTPAELEGARALVDPSAVCQVLYAGRGAPSGRGGRSIVWLALTANGEDLGALVGLVAPEAQVDPVQLDTAAVLAAHVAASLDAAVVLGRERQSAMTDSLTGILNRRGLERRLELALEVAQERRVPLSLLVIDCDDFKEINDRAGHQFGDALLSEVADALVRSLPEGAEAARLGGDEFVVVLPGADADAAEELGGQVRTLLADGLTDAGYPLRISAGVSTYPFDGATPTALMRAADQALYAAKDTGKDRIASFREVVRATTLEHDPRRAGDDEQRRSGRADGSVLSDAIAAARAIEDEATIEGVCSRLCKALVFIVGATACATSRVVGEQLVDACEHSLREVSLGGESSYLIAEYPLTAQTLRTNQARALSFLDASVDPAEAFILRELGMNALLMLPLHVAGAPWGLVELYEMRLRRFSADDIAVAEFLTTHAERRIARLADSDRGDAPTLYELPPGGGAPSGARTR